MLGGLDWTGTALGRAFKSQEQVLFMFASVIFIISVTLHLFSIPEQPFAPTNQLKAAESGESSSHLSVRAAGHMPPLLHVIAEEDTCAPEEGAESEPREGEMDFLAVDRARSKSDSILAMPDSTVELDPDLDPDGQLFHPETGPFLPDTGTELEDVFKASCNSSGSSPPPGPPPLSGSVDPCLQTQVRSAQMKLSQLHGPFSSVIPFFPLIPSLPPADQGCEWLQCWFVLWSV